MSLMSSSSSRFLRLANDGEGAGGQNDNLWSSIGVCVCACEPAAQMRVASL
jgi:hypothetical protein